MFSCAHWTDGIDKIFWINLDEAFERRNKMENMLKDVPIPVERISAINEKEIWEMRTGYFDPPGMFPPNRDVTKFGREVACLCSHIKTITEFGVDDESGAPDKIALIMEDDMTLDFLPYWTLSIKDIIRSAPNDWEIIQLCYITDFNPPECNFEKIKINNINGRYSTGAYLIRQSAAKRFVESQSSTPTLGSLLNTPVYYLADHYLYSVFCTYTYKYPYFTYSYIEKSYICNDREYFHQRSRYKLEKFMRTTFAHNNENLFWRCYIVGFITMVVMFRSIR